MKRIYITEDIAKELSEITSLEISTDWAIEELKFLNIEDEQNET